ncbi:hypothetical protein AMOR_01500 [Anaeromyxobacter oryzae]|uniref:Uncharacterized protein n=1 Tax=Anaeromyxobacter oryzae TaxID=2918170 RepID=A0ABM7WNW6_9BACT|nr:hypothetical protein AMOR_01500 [Anaeromyxobacter oryzae]
MPEERSANDVWTIGAAYDSHVGRWSRLVAWAVRGHEPGATGPR